MKRIAVIASGGGSNFQSIMDYFSAQGADAAAEVVVVASDRPQAGALARARAEGIDALVLDRESLEPAILDYLVERDVNIVVLAGYLKLIPPKVVDHFAGCMVNIHPALLPKFGGPGMYGLRVHQAVINSGEHVSGATVHLVTHEYDSGPALAQWPVAVLANDSAPSLAARVLAAEHALYPRVIDALARDDRSLFPLRPDDRYFADPPITPDAIERDIIAAFGR